MPQTVFRCTNYRCKIQLYESCARILGALHLIWSLKDHTNVREASIRIVVVAETITLVVNIGNQTSAEVTFIVVECLMPKVVLGCNFWDAHVEVICPRLPVVKLIDTAVLIINGPPKRSPCLESIPSDQEFIASKICASRKILHQ